MEEEILYKSNPAMFRNRPLIYLLFLILVALYGLGIFLLIIWYLKTKTKKITVTEYRVIYRTGLLSKNLNEIRLEDVSNVTTKQGFVQRLLSVGDVSISSSATDEKEISIGGIKNPQKLKELIMGNR